MYMYAYNYSHFIYFLRIDNKIKTINVCQCRNDLVLPPTTAFPSTFARVFFFNLQLTRLLTRLANGYYVYIGNETTLLCFGPIDIFIFSYVFYFSGGLLLMRWENIRYFLTVVKSAFFKFI